VRSVAPLLLSAVGSQGRGPNSPDDLPRARQPLESQQAAVGTHAEWPATGSARCSRPRKTERRGLSPFSGTSCIRDYCGSCGGSIRPQQKTSRPTRGSQPPATSDPSRVMTASSGRGCSRSRGTVSSTGDAVRRADGALPCLRRSWASVPPRMIQPALPSTWFAPTPPSRSFGRACRESRPR